ncbi:DnaA regulatory inactivator Hda [Salinimonas profundi]|uniref:DnaA regulatory inactivator Hda n=1 Tax=Salinimonas profundi TaxID=2729140 RepID=UPI001CC33136|nr:DnaA regulatory inactivator Hda [Salinimonas profundi]
MERIAKQLSLPVSLPADETFESFVAAQNQQLVALLTMISRETPDWSATRSLQFLTSQPLPLINIVGGEGQGKSHLLFALAHRLSARGVSHIYLNCRQLSALESQVLEGLENLSVIALDNMESISQNANWEEAIFDLLNRVTEKRKTIVICSSRQLPANTGFRLPDLESRLQWGTTFTLQRLDDEARKQAVRYRAEQKGLMFSDAALSFVLNHYDRNLKSLMHLLERLDARSLQEQRKISISMIKRELNLD